MTKTATKSVAAKKISGTKTVAEQAKALKNAKGPKPGQARSNQTAKLTAAPKANPDSIVSVKATTTGPDHIIVVAGGKTINVPRSQMTGQLGKLAKVGASIKAVEQYIKDHKPDARLARGITGRDAPQASKAVADQRQPATPAPKAKAEKKATAKREPKGAEFSYTIGKPADRAEGSWTQHMLVMMQKATDTGAARAAHAKSGKFADKKLHFSWARDKGYIKY